MASCVGTLGLNWRPSSRGLDNRGNGSVFMGSTTYGGLLSPPYTRALRLFTLKIGCEFRRCWGYWKRTRLPGSGHPQSTWKWRPRGPIERSGSRGQQGRFQGFPLRGPSLWSLPSYVGSPRASPRGRSQARLCDRDSDRWFPGSTPSCLYRP